MHRPAHPDPCRAAPPWRRASPSTRARAALASLLIALAGSDAASAATPADTLAAYAGAAGTAPDAARGQRFFTTPHGREWSCSSCHGAVPVQGGRHAATGRPIAALAPAAEARRFTDPAKSEKWFRRNCQDVVGRECSAAEKADVLAWLLTLR